MMDLMKVLGPLISTRLLGAFACALFVPAPASAGDFVLPSDAAFTLSASATDNLLPGQPIDIFLSVTNSGSAELPLILATSPSFMDEFQLLTVDPDFFFIVIISDLSTGGFEYLIEWDVAAAYLDIPPLAPEETRTCHFQIALGASAPRDYPFAFGLMPGFDDTHPGNDRPIVVLHRATVSAAAAPVPSSTPLLLVGLYLALTWLAWKNLVTSGRYRTFSW